MNNQKGFTLIELLAAVVIFAIVSIALTAIIIQAIHNNEEIKKDIALRDEAELILAQAVRNVYTTRESDINKVENNFIYIEIPKSDLNPSAKSDLYECTDATCTVRTGFQKITMNNQSETFFYIESTLITLGNSKIKIHPDSEIIRFDNNGSNAQSASSVPTYKIKLGVYIIDEDYLIKNDTPYTEWFENEITSINNL